jgi:hypothetical protein
LLKKTIGAAVRNQQSQAKRQKENVLFDLHTVSFKFMIT